eukprot:scaffold6942_cov72-Phaeocystis_antarctica.AAC.2
MERGVVRMGMPERRECVEAKPTRHASKDHRVRDGAVREALHVVGLDLTQFPSKLVGEGPRLETHVLRRRLRQCQALEQQHVAFERAEGNASGTRLAAGVGGDVDDIVHEGGAERLDIVEEVCASYHGECTHARCSGARCDGGEEEGTERTVIARREPAEQTTERAERFRVDGVVQLEADARGGIGSRTGNATDAMQLAVEVKAGELARGQRAARVIALHWKDQFDLMVGSARAHHSVDVHEWKDAKRTIDVVEMEDVVRGERARRGGNVNLVHLLQRPHVVRGRRKERLKEACHSRRDSHLAEGIDCFD